MGASLWIRPRPTHPTFVKGPSGPLPPVCSGRSPPTALRPEGSLILLAAGTDSGMALTPKPCPFNPRAHPGTIREIYPFTSWGLLIGRVKPTQNTTAKRQTKANF